MEEINPNIKLHLDRIKLINVFLGKGQLYVSCFPTDIGAICFQNSNRAITPIGTDHLELKKINPPQDPYLIWLDEQIAKWSRLAANEKGNEYHRFDGKRASMCQAREKYLSLHTK